MQTIHSPHADTPLKLGNCAVLVELAIVDELPLALALALALLVTVPLDVRVDEPDPEPVPLPGRDVTDSGGGTRVGSC